MKLPLSPCMIILALSEAELYFVDLFIEQGYLPNFHKLRDQGKRVNTAFNQLKILDDNVEPMNPWAVWPSIYTGLLPAQHGMTGRGQEGFQYSKHTIWAELDARGYSTGILGIPFQEPLQKTGLKQNKIQYYLPDPIISQGQQLSDLPFHSQSVHDLLLFTSTLYHKSNSGYYLKLLWKLFRAKCDGLPFNIIWKIAKKIPGDIFSPKKYYQHMLWYADLQMSIFEYLNNRFTPEFSICQVNLLSDVQVRFWRAFEPENFSENLSEVDKCFYSSIEERRVYEHNFKFAILESFMLLDAWLHKLMMKIDANIDAVLVVMNGLGQQRHDPGSDPNPSLLLHNIDKLMDFADITEYHLLDDKRQDLTLNFKNENEAELAVYKLSEIKLLAKKTFFNIKRIRHQLFLEANLIPEIWTVGSAAWLENEATGKIARLFDFVYFSPSIDQETAKRSDEAWMMLYGNLNALQKYKDINKEKVTRMDTEIEQLDITQIKGFLMQYFKGKV